jgi:hypothetical protein
MNRQDWNIIAVVVSVASLAVVLWPMHFSIAQDTSVQHGIVGARQAPPAPSDNSSVSDPTRSTGQFQNSGADFWKPARDPFAIPDAQKLCARGIVQACAVQTPSD